MLLGVGPANTSATISPDIRPPDCFTGTAPSNQVLQQEETIADYKAISQNLMHANISITDGIYAMLPSTDVRRRISDLRPPSSSTRGTKESAAIFGSQMAAVLRGLADHLSDA